MADDKKERAPPKRGPPMDLPPPPLPRGMSRPGPPPVPGRNSRPPMRTPFMAPPRNNPPRPVPRAPPEPEREMERRTIPVPHGGDSPPLFIKIEKYREVVRHLVEVKTYMLNLRDALDVIADVNKEIENGIDIARKTLDELNVTVTNLDSFIVRPESIEDLTESFEGEGGERDESYAKSRELEGYVKDVYGQLEKLKGQLRNIS